MKATLKEPEDKAIEGANKAAAGCGMIAVGVPTTGFIIWCVGIVFEWW